MAVERRQGCTAGCGGEVGLTLVGELVEATESVDLVIPHVGHRGIDEAGRLRADGGDELRLVALGGTPAVPGRARRHDEGVVGGARRRGDELAFRRVRPSRVASE